MAVLNLVLTSHFMEDVCTERGQGQWVRVANGTVRASPRMT